MDTLQYTAPLVKTFTLATRKCLCQSPGTTEGFTIVDGGTTDE